MQKINIKLAFSPIDDHREKRMVRGRIKTLIRKLVVLNCDKKLSTTSIATKMADIKNIISKPNTTSRITPFEINFGRRPDTQLSSISKQTI